MMNVLPNLKNILIVLTFLFVTSTQACDVCSCGAANNSGFISALQGNYIGLSYNYMHFTFKEGVFEDDPIAHDHINTINILGQYVINNWVQVNATIPYRFNNRATSKTVVSNHGLGDVTLQALVNLLPHKSKHRLKIGSGLKLPTGKFDLQTANTNQTSAIQLGTGSLDVLLPLQYHYTHKKLSVSINATYFIKNKNKEQFKYGNQTQINTQLIYKAKLKNYLLIPYLGLGYDHFSDSERFDVVDERTSGNLLNSTIGLNLASKSFTLGINYQFPVQQNLIKGTVAFKKGLGVYTYWKF